MSKINDEHDLNIKNSLSLFQQIMLLAVMAILAFCGAMAVLDYMTDFETVKSFLLFALVMLLMTLSVGLISGLLDCISAATTKESEAETKKATSSFNEAQEKKA